MWNWNAIDLIVFFRFCWYLNIQFFFFNFIFLFYFHFHYFSCVVIATFSMTIGPQEASWRQQEFWFSEAERVYFQVDSTLFNFPRGLSQSPYKRKKKKTTIPSYTNKHMHSLIFFSFPSSFIYAFFPAFFLQFFFSEALKWLTWLLFFCLSSTSVSQTHY